MNLLVSAKSEVNNKRYKVQYTLSYHETLGWNLYIYNFKILHVIATETKTTFYCNKQNHQLQLLQHHIPCTETITRHTGLLNADGMIIFYISTKNPNYSVQHFYRYWIILISKQLNVLINHDTEFHAAIMNIFHLGMESMDMPQVQIEDQIKFVQFTEVY